MSAIDPSAWMRQIRPILGTIRTSTIQSVMHEEERPVVGFITVSRQAGAGAGPLAERLVERLNQVDPGPVPWTSWDRELIEKVAADHHISRELVESLEIRDRSWLSDFIEGLAVSSVAPSEETVFRDVCTTVRALAQAGRVVIVGLGAMMTTRRMPGAIHVRLVAPLAYRIDAYAQRNGVNRAQAETAIRCLDHNREAFYARHWPSLQIEAHLFHLTLNVAQLSEQQMVDCILPLLVPSDQAHVGGRGQEKPPRSSTPRGVD